MGVVYLAEDMRLGARWRSRRLRWFVVTRPDRSASGAGRAAASLNHPGIAVVYALEIDAHLYIAGDACPAKRRDELGRGALDPFVRSTRSGSRRRCRWRINGGRAPRSQART
jgi:hypothetical protein